METEVQFAYSEEGAGEKKALDEYKSFIAQSGKTSLPVIVYIDKDNKVKFVEWGRSFEGEHIIKLLKSII